jgi:hypothetical protein
MYMPRVQLKLLYFFNTVGLTPILGRGHEWWSCTSIHLYSVVLTEFSAGQIYLQGSVSSSARDWPFSVARLSEPVISPMAMCKQLHLI